MPHPVVPVMPNMRFVTVIVPMTLTMNGNAGTATNYKTLKFRI